MYKIKKNRVPLYNFRQLEASLTNRGRIGLTRKRWSSAIQLLYNNLEPMIRNEQKISVFKKKIKAWIKSNIGIFNNDD